MPILFEYHILGGVIIVRKKFTFEYPPYATIKIIEFLNKNKTLSFPKNINSKKWNDISLIKEGCSPIDFFNGVNYGIRINQFILENIDDYTYQIKLT